MSLLRLYCPLRETPAQCEWAWVDAGKPPRRGRSRVTELPRADRVQLVVPANDTMIARVRLPQNARRSGPMLAFAVEELTLADPEANVVSWLGAVGDEDALAVLDKQGLDRWIKALEDAGIRRLEVQSELFLLECAADEWSLAWDGHEGFVRTGPFEGMCTDAGDRGTPPTTLRLLAEQAAATGRRPRAIAVYPAESGEQPDRAAWESALGIEIRERGPASWRDAPPDAGVPIVQQTRRWRGLQGMAPKLRWAAGLAGVALLLHGAALAMDWARLAAEQRDLRQRMEARFRAVFPEATAVVAPLLQMRRNLAEARHAAGQADAGDFLPMLGRVGQELRDLAPGAVRVLSFEGGRMTLDLMVADEASVHRMVARLRQGGLLVEHAASAGRSTLTVRAP